MAQPIPQPPGVPILGNIFNIQPSNPWVSLQKLAEQYGDIFQIKVLGRTMVFVASVALAEELCDEKRFRKYVGGPIVEIREAVHDSLFTAYDEEASWGIAHRILAPALAPNAVTQLFDEMRDSALELIQLWKGLGPHHRVSPLRGLQRLDLETVTRTLYGQKLDCLSGPEHPMIGAMEDATAEAVMRPTRPGIVNRFLYQNKFHTAIQTLRAYAGDVVRHRKEHPTGRQDLLALLMTAKDPETGAALTESQVIDEVITFPIGSSTSPCLVSAAILFLLQNPDAMAAAKKEVDAAVDTAAALTHRDLARLPLIEGILRESLRLSVAAPGFNIEPVPSGDKSPVVLGAGRYQVAHNQPMVIVLAGVHRDRAVFPDAHLFRPERMMGAAFDNLPPGAKRWFGNGKRECIGRHYAWQWCTVVLASLLRELDFSMADASYRFEQDGWFNLRPVGFFVKVQERAR